MKFKKNYSNFEFSPITKKKSKNYARNRKLRQENLNIRQIRDRSPTKFWEESDERLCRDCARVHIGFPSITLLGTLTDDGFLLESGDLISNGKFIPKSRGPLIKVK